MPTREEALTKFAHAVFNRLFDMARGKEDNPAAIPLLRVEASLSHICLHPRPRGGRITCVPWLLGFSKHICFRAGFVSYVVWNLGQAFSQAADCFAAENLPIFSRPLALVAVCPVRSLPPTALQKRPIPRAQRPLAFVLAAGHAVFSFKTCPRCKHESLQFALAQSTPCLDHGRYLTDPLLRGACMRGSGTLSLLPLGTPYT